ncbi:hypothetical protein DXG03_008921 [Asterophora parasitica]|uniref:LYR motif-containing protein Cup1-like N-terminal domain-containing protein n=1 Tax=Asterophora parasitica TaxID=117018 RepID=A0A9P7GF81_9AGAR|nr:hypothetical protein DXG03_008921 [Asterophora parasitica]
MAALSKASIISLYRAYVRQIRRLPVPYLQHFFRIKASDDIGAILRSSTSKRLHGGKVKRLCKDLSKIEAANHGSTKAFGHILDLAYGRKGKLKWELMKPLLSDPNAHVPPPIIPAVEKSRPPVYSPEMKALLTSSQSRKNKPLALQFLDFPPTLPARANPTSEDARLLGPFSKRREVNIRWRYFAAEWKKVRPPLHVVTEDSSSSGTHQGTSQTEILRAGIRGMGFQGHGVFDDAEARAGPPEVSKPLTRREGLRDAANVDVDVAPPLKSQHPSRWLRRRYQSLLRRIPVLTYSSHSDKCGETLGKYSVSLSPNARSPRSDPEVEAADSQEWLNLASKKGDGKKPKRKTRIL